MVKKPVSINEIYKEVRDYDLVLTVDAPLADALCARLDEPRLDEFAVTPRVLVSSRHQNEEVVDDRGIFLRVVDETHISWKRTFHILENVISCWKGTGDLREILNYEDFDNEEVLEIIKVIEEMPNIYSFMEEYEPVENRKTVVLGLYQFNELDKKVLPENYDTLDLFVEGEQGKLPKFNIFGTVTGMIRTIRENVNRNNADDVAIVVAQDSSYPSLLKSAFRAEGTPFMFGRNFAEDQDLRTYLDVLRLGLYERRLRLRDVQPVLRRIGHPLPVTHDEEFLNDLDIEALEELKGLLSCVRDSTFGEMLDEFEGFVSGLDEVRKHLEGTGILVEDVSEEALNRLEYYLDSFDVRTESGERGVLLASSKSSTFIDRPVVFYLGMDSKWEHSTPEKPWVSLKNFRRKNLENFRILLQNGIQQHFLVRDSTMGKEITPCTYLDEVLDEDFGTFSDLPHRRYWISEEKEDAAFEKKDYDIDVKKVDVISQSDLRNFVQSPKQYFFSKLVSMENKYYFKRGTLFHDFAEFYVNHSSFVKKRGVDKFVNVALQEIDPFIENFKEDIFRTEFRLGMENIIDYLDLNEPDSTELKDYGRSYGKNVFVEEFHEPIILQIAETWFQDPDFGARGKIDLIMEEDHLVDYKSGRKKSAWSVVKNSNVDLFGKRPDFQPILYLAYHRRIVPDSKLKFTFFHLLENIGDKISGKANIEDNLVTVSYYPRKFEDQVAEEEIFNYLVEGVSKNNNRRKTLERMGYDKFGNFFESCELPDVYDKEELLSSELAESFVGYAKGIVGDYKYVERGCRSALSKLVKFRLTNYFKEDLDKFDGFLIEQLGRLNECRREGFPVGDADPDDLDNRDLIVGDDFGAE